MIYVIDANNLAGKLPSTSSGQVSLLGEDDFDKLLIFQVKKYFEGKGIKVILVFDSNDFMGDKRIEDNFDIIYTPRDSVYKCADDKVLEIIENYLDDKKFKDKIVVVSDDIELRDKIKEKIDESSNGHRMSLIRATDFAKKMSLKMEVPQEESAFAKVSADEKKDDFSDREVDELNNELLNKWNKD